ncbi:helix-turn-helix transcriptional regulator [Vibrio splendidus]|uniref:YafY family transcriptional regulator n=1 Tax=Vibrio splendidus TaxID=29497 RepID=A0A2T5ERG7_VIBSP|nr:YafY family protein [Vibrio splendidus]OEF72890.1 transcriptional regulator [Vibrio splendidus 1F-157]PTP27922.1 YafY family transcriptional regulator [Vibrio splendidus]PTP69463.1 YafY family transcriptional regulator [Vibrio splendidus]
MSRSQRLFDLLQLLRCHKYLVTADYLAIQLNVSTRTIYRDIVTLQAQGAEIDGEAGVGYLLKPTFTLPPMMFSTEELEALRLGAEWVAKQANGEFSESAKNAIAKISAVLPADHQAKRSEDIVRVASIIEVAELTIDLSDIKFAIKQQNKAEIHYTDAKAKISSRIVWPMLIGLFEQQYVLVAWCETRSAYRNFRLDRITEWKILEQKYQHARHDLIKDWQNMEGIADKVIRY